MNWFWDYFGLSHGITAFQTFSDFLIGLPGGCGVAVVGACNGSRFSNILNTNNFAVRSGPGGIVHGYKARNGSAFVQDDIKVSDRLTLNAGLRWEYDGLMADKYGNATNLWLSQLASVNGAGRLGFPQQCGDRNPGWLGGGEQLQHEEPRAGRLRTAAGRRVAIEQPGSQQERSTADGLCSAPGFCMAAAIGGNKLVIRGGGGFFYDRVPGNTIGHAVEQSPPYAETLDQSPGTNQFSSLAQPFQNIPLGTFPTRWLNFANNTGSDLAQSFMVDNLITPLIYSYNLNVQYQLAPSWMVELGYVGSRGIHQPNSLHILNGALIASPTTPINGITVSTSANTRLRVPYLGFSPTGLQAADNQGDIKYNSFQFTLRKQLSYGLNFQAAYTFSRAFTTQGYSTGAPPGPGQANIGNPTEPQYGLNPQYRPERLVLNYSYEIPSPAKGFLGVLTKGWTLAGVTTIQGGQPLTVLDTRGGGVYGLSGAPALLASTAQMAPGMTYAQHWFDGRGEHPPGGSSQGMRLLCVRDARDLYHRRGQFHGVFHDSDRGNRRRRNGRNRLRQFGRRHVPRARPVRLRHIAHENDARGRHSRRCPLAVPRGVLQPVQSPAICRSREQPGAGKLRPDYGDFCESAPDPIGAEVHLLGRSRNRVNP